MKFKSLLALTIALILMGMSHTMYAFTPDITVALDGSGDYIKIQDAIDASPANESRRTIIYIKAGLYNTEKLIIPTNKTNITLIGESRDQTIISYHIYDCGTGKCPANDAALWTGDNIRTAATLTIMGDNFRAENITFQNTAGPVGQAQAVTIRSDKAVFINCDFKGYQDTIYLWTDGKRSYFENCMILGRTDYIYGGGVAFFQGCEIRSWGGGWITAPATKKELNYGYVFNECNLTYVSGSPRTGDDGVKFRLGRPWHNYPKVAWLRCDFTDMVNPLGWGDSWNMDYAPTSEDLHLYEYLNTGGGADMSGRANWAGLRALTDAEALNYTVQKVLAGTDGWDPSAEAPLVKTYTWTGSSNSEWKNAANWNPSDIPAKGEIANADGNSVTIDANGETFEADLNLSNGATLNISQNSTASYIAAQNAIFTAASNVTLSGKIGTKDVNTFNISGNLNLSATIVGVHKITKTGQGVMLISSANPNYSGLWHITEGSFDASVENALGLGDVTVSNVANLIVNNDNAFFPKSVLKVSTGSQLTLNATITLSEFYIDDALQPTGTYDSSSNPSLITGNGSIIIGRPASFLFNGGNWDDAAKYSPALLPEEGEIVFCEGEMETTSTINLANIFFVNNKGKLRMRGNHKSTGTLTFEGGNRINYATSGAGFSLDAPIVAAGDFNFEMNSSNANNSLTLTGPISGSAKISVRNTRGTEVTTATAILSGNNSAYTGTWDLTTPASNVNSTVAIEGKVENAFGSANILVGANNKVVFSHSESASTNNELVLAANAKAILNADITIGKLTIDGTEHISGIFSSTTHSNNFEGAGTLTIGTANSLKLNKIKNNLQFTNNQVISTNLSLGQVTIYNLNGSLVYTKNVEDKAISINLPLGVYVVSSENNGILKIVVTH
jgi:pectin methylesterase-like acyl-CoA thioesterase